MYKQVFQDCISRAPDEIGQYLSYILMRIQIHNSRMVDLRETRGSIGANINTYLYRISEIQSLINKNFDYVRGLEDFDSSPVSWDDYSNALSNLDIWHEDYDDLEGFIKRAIKREENRLIR